MERRSPLISHESPISLLQESLQYNDYDYCLVHLMEQEPKYKEFFLKSAQLGRRILLDTSIFELGEAFDLEKYATWVKTLCPYEYILPDVLEDCDATINNSKAFMEKYPNLPGKKIGVVQGKTFAEIKKCYETLDKELDVDKIAISFDYSYYKNVAWHPNKWVSFMNGRVWLITELMKLGIINKDKPHHLLGCSNPLEFSFYKHPDFNFIETLDTSSPVVHGLHKKYYLGEIGDWQKETTKLADLINANVDDQQKAVIFYNIKEFRRYVW